MKKIIFIIAILAIAATSSYAISPKEAMQKLREGNERFIAGKSIHPNISAERLKSTAELGQKPFATILACSDSRSPVEVLFDQGVGDLFVIKVAGNVADVDEIATIEYGTDHLKTPVLVVLGHTKCGAVTAVATEAELHGHLPQLVDNIKPAYDKAKHNHPEKHGKDIVPHTINANIFQSIEDIISKSPIVAKLIKSGSLEVVGALYDIESGSIEWLGNHPKEKELVANSKEVAHHSDTNDKSFFSTPNFIYMGIFVLIVSIIATVLIFVFSRKRN